MQITDIAYRVPLPKAADRTTSIDLKCIVTKLINYGVQKSNTGTNGSVIEGVQQPYEISIVTGIQQARDITLFCTVYPNPANDLLTLEVEIADNENLFYQLYEIKGKLLVSKRLIDKKTTISMVNLAPAAYFLKITDHQKVVKTFKIIKTQ